MPIDTAYEIWLARDEDFFGGKILATEDTEDTEKTAIDMLAFTLRALGVLCG